MISEAKIEKGAKILIITLVFSILVSVVSNRHETRQARLETLDESNLEQTISTVKQKTLELKKAAELNPVWVNWSQAKKIAKDFGLDLRSAQVKGKRERSRWVGVLSGDSLEVIGVARKIQQNLAAEVITFNHLGASAKLEIAILGTKEAS